MKALKSKFLLFITILTFAAKPFIGFGLYHIIVSEESPCSIIVKAFNKRKQEYVDDSDMDIAAVQHRLADPLLFTSLVFSFFLTRFFPFVFCQVSAATAKILSDIRFRLTPPHQLYLLTGKLSI